MISQLLLIVKTSTKLHFKGKKVSFIINISMHIPKKIKSSKLDSYGKNEKTYFERKFNSLHFFLLANIQKKCVVSGQNSKKIKR